MTALLSRWVMALAVRSFGHRRREWAHAMLAELEAVPDGKALPFATGCLLAAWREMPTHADGRLRLTRHMLALGLIAPVAALLLSGALFGASYPDFPHAGLFTLGLGDAHPQFLNAGNRTAAPVVTLLLSAIAAMHFAAAAALLDRDWTRLAALGRLGAATTITLAVFAALALLDPVRTLLPIAALVVETAAVSALVHLHARDGSEDAHVAR